MDTFYDALETRDATSRERALFAALPAQVALARQRSPAFARLLADVDPATVQDRATLARLPVTRKAELLALQQASRDSGGDAFGGFATEVWGPVMPRVFASPGTLYEPDGARPDHWRMARAFYAAGVRAGQLLHNSFSYHFVPAGAMMESGAQALGCTVFPGGTGQTEQQLQAMVELRADAYVGTPSFLRILLEKAAERGTALPHLRRALVSGEAFPPSLRDWVAERGVRAFQCYASADLGLIAYETEAREGLVLDEGVILEIVRPGTGEPVADGEVGEVVVTTFNPVYPLLRFGTGDLSAVMPGPCPTGRTNTRIRGWMGRADQTTKVRGMFVHPGQVAEIGRRVPGVGRMRLVVSGEMADDRLLLRAECASADGGVALRLGEVVREVTRLRAEVELCALGSLPNDGKVIEDGRSYR
ncbi:phenylacetate--CoA ligase family protein [Xylophilus sp. GOD-11R]|uniref:phenylacetate--CoA ligase family protein n=1 Tax=Xylophilus sp. GOD-11R TaxID=3089814 RepID=UPI00298D079E|nr:AMP-binding protein [Xylophilus sp. GOD-11R]WPB59539.1 AMP-binding protein [Xylophilus sp. GOD-11R]